MSKNINNISTEEKLFSFFFIFIICAIILLGVFYYSNISNNFFLLNIIDNITGSGNRLSEDLTEEGIYSETEGSKNEESQKDDSSIKKDQHQDDQKEDLPEDEPGTTLPLGPPIDNDQSTEASSTTPPSSIPTDENLEEDDTNIPDFEDPEENGGDENGDENNGDIGGDNGDENGDENGDDPVVPPTPSFTNITTNVSNTSYTVHTPFTITVKTNISGVNINVLKIEKNGFSTSNCTPNIGTQSSTEGRYTQLGLTNESRELIVSFNNGCEEIGSYVFYFSGNYQGTTRQTNRTITINIDAPENGEIQYLEHLAYIATNSNSRSGNYILMRDLDFNNDSHYLNILNKSIWTTGDGWNPIGYKSPHNVLFKFTGSFNGNNKTISNLYINRINKENIGLFGFIETDAVIFDLSLENINVIGKSYVGGLVSDSGGDILNCHVTGTVVGNDNDVGGVSGINYGTISDTYFTGSVNGNLRIGGLVGRNNLALYRIGGTIVNSHSDATVTGNSRVGGFVGSGAYGYISDCSSSGFVIGNNDVGGFVSFISGLGDNYAEIHNSYSTGTVKGNNNVGGFIGYLDYGKISNSYSLNNVVRKTNSSGTNVGGFVGRWDRYPSFSEEITNSYSIGSVVYEGTENPTNKGFIGYSNTNNLGENRNFWNITTSQQTTNTTGATGKTDSQMKQQSTFIDWDFNTVWNIQEGVIYPYLRNNN